MDDSPPLTAPHNEVIPEKSDTHGALLAFSTALFACRVVGQALVAFIGVPWLP